MGAGLGMGMAMANMMGQSMGVGGKDSSDGGAAEGPGVPLVTCPACGKQVPEGKFCPECGEILQGTCSACGKPLVADSKFCPECGARQTSASCIKCGADLEGEDKFCPECGTGQE